VQDDEQPDDWWDDALYVEDSDDSEYLYLLIQPPNLHTRIQLLTGALHS